MASVQKTFAVALTIPDNEAFTACETLRHMGLAVGNVRRADIWTFAVEPTAAETLGATIATIETIFNPNKHRLTERPGSHPLEGEVWIGPQREETLTSVGGRALPGVGGITRRVGWQLVDDEGRIVAPDVLERAVETFLCNTAFQKAIR